ncbi:MAG: hypothetical protein HQ523_03310 [Lentisphaerae bacterium]|nr:hypothetical protein [Lentisphaerota bacterium]
MSSTDNLDALIERILSKGRKEADTLTERAQKAAEREVGQVEEQARKRAEAAEAAWREAMQERRHSREAEVRQAERRSLMNEREQAVNVVFEEALQKLSVVTDPAPRRELLVGLIRQGIRVVGGEAVCVCLNAAELALTRDPTFPKEIDGVTVSIKEEPIDCAGGPVVTDPDGRIVFENTFEARLGRARESLRRQVAHSLQLHVGEGEV